MSNEVLSNSLIPQTESFVSYGLVSQEAPIAVYIGHICGRVPDESVLDLLSLCGDVMKWTRQSDPVNGVLMHFGFCEFRRIEAAFRAIDYLDGQHLGSKKLVVKVDSKISDKIEGIRLSNRLNQQNEEKVRGTINALITTINQAWRSDAVIRDTQSLPKLVTQPQLVPAPKEANVLPDWYKESRREMDRMRAIEKRKRDRAVEFRRALEQWERGPERRFLEEVENESELVKEFLVKKKQLIEQDGVDGFKVRSNFTLNDRKKEIDFDMKDEAAEEREIVEKQSRDKAHLERLESELKRALADNPHISGTISPVPIPSSSIPDSFRTKARELPKNVSDIEIFKLDWDWVYEKNVLGSLQPWLVQRVSRTCKLSYPAAVVLSKYIVKTIQVIGKPWLSEIVFKVSSILPETTDGVEAVCARVFQLLILARLIDSDKINS